MLGVEEGYNQTRSWIKEDLRDKEMIFIPVQKNDHFSLVYVNIKEGSVNYLDSLIGSRKTSNAPRIIKDFMEKYYRERGELKQFKMKTWWKIPTQHNGVDCGVFISQYAERLARRAGLTFSQADMPGMRWKMTWEILNNTLKENISMTDTQTGGKKTTRVKKGSDKTKVPPTKMKTEVKTSPVEQTEERKKKIKWPAGNSGEWSKLDTDLTMILREVGRTPEAKAENHPKIIYKFCSERFGEVETRKEKKSSGKPSRRNRKGADLRERINKLKRAWEEAPEEEKDAVAELQAEEIRKLRHLKRAESLKLRRRSKTVKIS